MQRIAIGGNEVVGDAERPDTMWENLEAERRREVFKEERQALTASIRLARENLTLPERLRHAIDRCNALSHSKAKPVGSEPPSAADTSRGGRRPNGASGLDPEPYLSRIQAVVEEFERDMDEDEGLIPARSRHQMIKEEKDREIVERFRGVPSDAIARDFPELGSARTIERVRKAAGLRPSNGLEMAA